MIPESIEVVTESIDARGVQFVQPPVPGWAIDDEAGVFQDAQVLRDRRTAHGEAARELADRLRSIQQTFEDRPAGRIAEGVELLRMSVSNH